MGSRHRLVCIILTLAMFASVPYAAFFQTESAQAKTKHRETKKELIKDTEKASGSKVKSFNSKTDISKLKSGRELIAYVKKLRKSYTISFVMIDVNTGEGVCCVPKKRMYSASCLKGPYVAALNKYKPKSYKLSRSLMLQTVTVSNNDTYASLHRRYGSGPMIKMKKYSGATGFDATRKYTYIRTRDLAKMWIGTYWYFYRNKNKNSFKARRMYTHGTQSFIYRAMKGKYRVHTKPGWFPGGGFNVQNDAGVVIAKSGGEYCPYVISVMTSACGQHKKLRKLVRLIDNVHRDMYKRAAE